MNTLLSTVCVASMLSAVCLVLPAAAQTVEATCELHYRDRILGEGPCTAEQLDNDTVILDGVVSENGKTYKAIINNRSNYGTLIGAGTFTLAEGKLISNEPTRVIFGNDYEIDLILPNSARASVSDQQLAVGAAGLLIGALFASALDNDGGNVRTESFQTVCGVIVAGETTEDLCTVEDTYTGNAKTKTVLRYPDIAFEFVWGEGDDVTISYPGSDPQPASYSTSEGETDVFGANTTYFYISDPQLARREVQNFQP